MIKHKFFSYFFSFAILFSLFGILNLDKLNQNDNFAKQSETENLVNVNAAENIYTAKIDESGRTNIKFTVLSVPEDFFPEDYLTEDIIFAFSIDQHADRNDALPDENFVLNQIIDNGDGTYNLSFNVSSLDSSTTYQIYSIFGWYEYSNDPGVWIPFSENGDGVNEIQLLNENGELGISATTKMSAGYFYGIMSFIILIFILLIAIIVVFLIRYNAYRKTKEKYDLLNKEIK